MEISEYLPLVIFVALAVVVGVAVTALGHLFGPKNPTRQKRMPYEAGSDQVARPSELRFSVKFYMIAISFILFDLETVFVIPWAIAWKQNEALGHGLYAFMVMLIFVTVLIIGLVYEWKQGGLEWD